MLLGAASCLVSSGFGGCAMWIVFLALSYAVDLDAPGWTVTGSADENFGRGIEGVGDVNGDGFDDVVVAAQRYGYPGLPDGRVWMYLGSAAGLDPTPVWSVGGQNGTYFGGAITSGDVNGDGITDIAISDTMRVSGTSDPGAVHIFHGVAGSVPGPSATQIIIGVNAGDVFGFDVAIDDFNGDGFGDLVAGARLAESADGKAFAHAGSALGLSVTPTWSYTGEHHNARFGQSTSTIGDVTGDGRPNLIIGESLYTGTQTREGLAHLFNGDGATTLGAVPLSSYTPQVAHGRAGHRSIGLGDINGDGALDYAVSGSQSTQSIGHIWVFAGRSDGTTPSTTPIQTLTGVLGEGYGGALGAADLNADGINDLLVSAWLADQPGTETGAVFVYLGDGTSFSAVPDFTIGQPVEGGILGARIENAGDVNGDCIDDVLIGGEGGFLIVYGSLSGPTFDGSTSGPTLCDDSDGDGVFDSEDPDDSNPYVCGDTDTDGCDDCSQFGYTAPLGDGPDRDRDGECNARDDDDDGDGLLDGADSAPLDPSPVEPDACPSDPETSSAGTCGCGFQSVGGGCVAWSAVVTQDSTVGAGATVMSRALVGATNIGPGAIIGPSAYVGIGSDIGAGAVLARRAGIGQGSRLGASVMLANRVQVGNDVSISGGTVGYGSTIGELARIGPGTTIGNLVTIGRGAWISQDGLGGGARLMRKAQVGDSAVVGSNASLGPATTVGEGTTIGADVRLRRDVTVGADAEIQSQSVIGRRAVIGARSWLAEGTILRGGVIVQDDACVDTGGTPVNRDEVLSGGC